MTDILDKIGYVVRVLVDRKKGSYVKLERMY